MNNIREVHTDLLQMESMFHSIREEAVVFFKQYFRVLGKTEVELSDEVLCQDSAYTSYLSHLILWPLRLFKERQYCFRNKLF